MKSCILVHCPSHYISVENHDAVADGTLHVSKLYVLRSERKTACRIPYSTTRFSVSSFASALLQKALRSADLCTD